MLRKIINETAQKNKNITSKAQIKNIYIKNEDTHIPLNLPTAIIAEKGSGKSTLLKALMNATYKNTFNHIYFIFSSLSWDEELPSYITKINIDESEKFLSNYFAIKSLYISYTNFILKLNQINNEKITNKELLKQIIEAADNNIIKDNQTEFSFLTYFLKNYEKTHNALIRESDENKVNRYIEQLINKSTKFVKNYSKDFYIDNIKLDGIRKEDRDAIIIDDIAIASKVLFKQLKDSSIYKYLTLTRHMNLCIIFAGQQIEQIPKYIRREIMCWIFSKNTTLDLLDGVLSNQVMQRISMKQTKLSRYEFALYNSVEDFITII